MLPGKKYSIDDIVRIAWRRKWLIAAPLVVVSIAVAMYAKSMPDVYRSQTTILIVPQKVPESYVRATVTTPIEERLPSLRQQILSRDRLERTIRDFNLYQQERGTESMEKVVAGMRAAINVDIVRGDTFSVGYISNDPRAAMLVVERLAAQFIEENAREREVMAEGTNEFLETQLVEARRRLEDHEHKLAEYRQQYSGQLPSQLDSNLQILSSLNLQAQGVANDLERDRDRLIILDRSLNEGDDTMRTPAGAAAAPTADAGGDGPAAGSAADRLTRARASLEELLLRLTPEHPDVGAAQRLVADLEKKAAAEARESLAAARPAGGAGQADTQAAPVSGARARRLQELRIEKQNVERQIARRQQEQVRVRQQISEYQTRVEATPSRETEMIGLTRDYQTLQEIYRGLLAKKEDSSVAANLERRQIGEQFKVIEPPRVPQAPFSPNRPQIALLGMLAGLAIGLGIAGLLEFRDATIKTEDDVRNSLQLPVLAAIPVITSEGDGSPRHKTAAAEALRLARRLMKRGTSES